MRISIEDWRVPLCACAGVLTFVTACASPQASAETPSVRNADPVLPGVTAAGPATRPAVVVDDYHFPQWLSLACDAQLLELRMCDWAGAASETERCALYLKPSDRPAGGSIDGTPTQREIDDCARRIAAERTHIKSVEEIREFDAEVSDPFEKALARFAARNAAR